MSDQNELQAIAKYLAGCGNLEDADFIRGIATKLADAEADAARYRWWVQNAWFYRSPLCLQQAWPKHSEIGIGDEQTKKEAIDAAMDATRSEV